MVNQAIEYCYDIEAICFVEVLIDFYFNIIFCENMSDKVLSWLQEETVLQGIERVHK